MHILTRTDRFARKHCSLCFIALVTAVFPPSTGAQVNAWTAPGSGNWEQPANWSLGAAPGNSQSVLITNSGWKAVAINGTTASEAPNTMSIGSLTIRGAWDTYNTLLLNFTGTAVPLTVSNGITLAENAQIVNFNSGLVVRGGTVTLTNAQIVQDGGVIRMTNSAMNFFNAQYHLTNGVFEAGSVLIGLEQNSRINQYGGVATIANLGFAFSFQPGSGTRGYYLYGGTLNLPGGLPLEGRGGTVATYLQEGGTNRTTDILLEPGLTGPSPTLTLNGGLLADNNVNVFADTIITRFTQNGGTHSVSNTVLLKGGTRTGTVRPAIYAFNGGNLSARNIILDSREGDSFFTQTNGIAQAQVIQANGFPFTKSELSLSGGTLISSNLFLTNGANLFQSSGALVVSNTLSLTGFREPGPKIYSSYAFSGGTLFASNITVGADWIIGDGSANRISNPGTVRLSHLIQIGNAVEQLGRFILATNATINLAGTSSQLSFANSSSETWTGGTLLMILNWNGSLAGGGGEQIKFGTNQSGLTSAQLNQIRFQIGSPTQLYSAKILSPGEVVPDQPVGGMLAFSWQGTNLQLTWPSGWTLQFATNVSGPYADVPGATSLYNALFTGPRRFFRLRGTP